MKKPLLACAALAAVIASGAAYADNSLSGLRRFDGFYLGVNGGGAFTSANPVTTPDGTYFDSGNLPAVQQAGASTHFNLRRAVGGLQAGYNLQGDHWLVGFETDFEFLPHERFEGHGRALSNQRGAVRRAPRDQHQLAADRATARRPGLGSSPALCDGWPRRHRGRPQQTFADGYGAYANGSKSAFMLGWTAGAGIEYRLGRAWSVKAEYLHADFGNLTSTGTMTPSFGTEAFHNRVNVTTDIARLGINYHFGMPKRPFVEAGPMVPLPVAAPAPPPPPPTHEFIVFFDFDRSTLTPEARRVVEVAAQYAKEHGTATLQVVGYTDLAGGADYNMRLSQARAKPSRAISKSRASPRARSSNPGTARKTPGSRHRMACASRKIAASKSRWNRRRRGLPGANR